MIFFRKHIEKINKATLGAFIASWFLLVAVIPAQVVAMAESHSIFWVYNPNEDCFELVMDHHMNADEDHLSDIEDHENHSFHSSCCFDDFIVKIKKPEFDNALNFDLPVYKLQTLSFQTTTPLEYSEYNLPPPPILDVLRVTRLLI